MIEPRLYRAAFLPALLAAVIAAFSLEDRPPAVSQGLPADVLFDGGLASSRVGEIVHAAPDRRVGSPGDLRTARTVAGAFRGFGFTTTVDRFRDDETPLVNVIGRRPGLSPHEVVLLASRHAPSVPRATGSGERAAPEGQRRLADIDHTRYGELGRSALRVVSALDATHALPAHGPHSYVLAGGGVVPGWALALLAAALILPALVASVDALARAGRRHEPVTRWLAWTWFGALPLALGLALADLLVLAGLAKDAPPTPLDPSRTPVDGRALADLVAVSLTILVCWAL